MIYWIYFKAVAGHNANLYVGAMKLAEIEQEALALPERERAALVAKLLDTLPPPGMSQMRKSKSENGSWIRAK